MTNFQQAGFWGVILIGLTLIFNRFFTEPFHAFFFVSMLLPVIIGTAFFFNYFLVPQYLHSRRYGLFFLYFLYTLIISIYLEMIVLTAAFVYIANYTYDNLNPVSTDIFVLVAILYLIVLLQAFVLEFRRSQRAQRQLRELEANREKEREGTLSVRANRKQVPVPYSEILYIESLSDYVKLVLQNGEPILTKERISHLDRELPDSFLRIHRSFIINLNQIDAFTREHVQIGEQELPISRTYKKQAFETLTERLT
jgi:two-component system response regulator LytT